MTKTKINSMKLNSITEMNDNCNTDWIEQGLTSYSTHFRSFRRQGNTDQHKCR